MCPANRFAASTSLSGAHDAKSINAKEAHVEATMATNCSRARPHRPFGTTLLESWAKILACTQEHHYHRCSIAQFPGASDCSVKKTRRPERERARERYLYIYMKSGSDLGLTGSAGFACSVGASTSCAFLTSQVVAKQLHNPKNFQECRYLA